MQTIPNKPNTYEVERTPLAADMPNADKKRAERNRKARESRKARNEARESAGLTRCYVDGREVWE